MMFLQKKKKSVNDVLYATIAAAKDLYGYIKLIKGINWVIFVAKLVVWQLQWLDHVIC